MTDTDKLKRLAENLKKSYSGSRVVYAEEVNAILALIAERDEAVALLREHADVGSSISYWSDIHDFLARIDAAD